MHADGLTLAASDAVECQILPERIDFERKDLHKRAKTWVPTQLRETLRIDPGLSNQRGLGHRGRGGFVHAGGAEEGCFAQGWAYELNAQGFVGLAKSGGQGDRG
jgi:hypothetical protein